MVGTRRGSLGISVLAEPCAPSRIYESGPLFIECWFMNGNQTAPALQAGLSTEMLKENRHPEQELNDKNCLNACGMGDKEFLTVIL